MKTIIEIIEASAVGITQLRKSLNPKICQIRFLWLLNEEESVERVGKKHTHEYRGYLK